MAGVHGQQDGHLMAPVQHRIALVVVLAVTSGATDAIGFLALGGSFTSVMTGNLVLMGVAIGDADASLAVSVGSAIISFVVGAAVGARIAGKAKPGDPVWPSAITRALEVELSLLSVYAVVWWMVGPDGASGWVMGMLMLNACALGLQSSAIQRFGISGLSTTYLTGTLTSVVISLVSGGTWRSVRRSVALLAALVVGALLGTVLLRFAPVAMPLLQLLTVAAVLVVVYAKRRTDSVSRTPVPVG
jgi:uncharacterized membrane protein YoaK (UPF0700 family)